MGLQTSVRNQELISTDHSPGLGGEKKTQLLADFRPLHRQSTGFTASNADEYYSEPSV